MKIVLDANVIVLAFFWGGNPRLVLERAITGVDALFASKEIIDEIEEVMGRPKFHASKEGIVYFINALEEIVHKIIPELCQKPPSPQAGLCFFDALVCNTIYQI